jgi:predicted ATP-binding protein involved in virulence
MFITNIHIGNVRHLLNVDIALSNNERRHLILTGKNGCGKTSLLEAMARFFDTSYTDSDVSISFSREVDLKNSSWSWLYINSHEERVSNLSTLKKKELIENRFDSFQPALAEIYDCPELKLVYDAELLDFIIELPDRKSFTLNQMSDGYFALANILFEIILRLDNHRDSIVLIDDLESHLHIELQKRILPILTKMFPNTQFIVATHSPFIISSISNAVLYDLGTNRRLEGDLTQYSYSDIVEGYFDVSECSAALQADFDRYVKLVEQPSRTDYEIAETRNLFERLSKIPGTSPLSTAFYMFERGRRNGKTEK